MHDLARCDLRNNTAAATNLVSSSGERLTAGRSHMQAVVTATLFLRTNLHPNSVGDGQVYFGVIFFSLIMVLFDGFAEETLTVRLAPTSMTNTDINEQYFLDILHPSFCLRPVIASPRTTAFCRCLLH